MVMHNWCFGGAFDLHENTQRVVCPMCYGKVDPVKPGFNNCYYKVVAASPSISPSLYTKPWTRSRRGEGGEAEE
eukprot:jgi/Tetstr1/464410/TSEL_009202.t1